MRFLSTILLGLVFLATGCGSGNNSRQLQTITLTSAASGEQVQFTATGHYTQVPLTVTPIQAFWAVILLNNQSGPTINQEGLAECKAGVPGNFTVAAYAPANPSVPVTNPPQSVTNVLGVGYFVCP